ncbi:hypothetical protein Aduo_004776 [Ancylostoma duodenale]
MLSARQNGAGSRRIPRTTAGALVCAQFAVVVVVEQLKRPPKRRSRAKWPSRDMGEVHARAGLVQRNNREYSPSEIPRREERFLERKKADERGYAANSIVKVVYALVNAMLHAHVYHNWHRSTADSEALPRLLLEMQLFTGFTEDWKEICTL